MAKITNYPDLFSMDLSFVYAAPVSVASSIAQTVENIVNNPADALLSNASTILLLFAIYSTIKSFSTLVLTPSVCSSAPDSKVAGSRRRLLALHGLNLAVRWGFGVTWLIAKQLQSLGSSTFQPQDLQGLDLKALALRPLEMSLINAPAYRNASFQDMAASNFFQGMLLFDLLMVFFDLGFSNEFWTNLLESSKVFPFRLCFHLHQLLNHRHLSHHLPPVDSCKDQGRTS